jgi:hypothetical protein
LPLAFIPIDLYWLKIVISLLCAGAVGWFVWTRTSNVTDSKGLGTSIIFGAIVTGSVGFAAGFFGPMIFMPDANQGPLIGIFITGPGGFLLGGFGGLIYWLVKNKKSAIA